MKFYANLLILLPSFSFAYWTCPQNPILQNTQTFNVFPTGNDLFYGPNADCNLQINVPDGMFVTFSLNSIPAQGDSIIGHNNYLNIPFSGNAANLIAVGPSPFVFTIRSTSVSDGSFQIIWQLRNVTFNNQQRITIGSGQQPLLLSSYDVAMSSKTLVSASGKSLAISTASYGKLGTDFMLTGAFLYRGDKITPGPLVCLFNRLSETIPFKADGTVTIVFLGVAVGAATFSVNSWNDVAQFSRLQLSYYDNFGSDGRFVLDAANGTAAMTLYQADNSFDLMTSYILSTQTIFSIYAGGAPLSNAQKLSSYGVSPGADNYTPQPIPGGLKTFVIEKGTVSIYTVPNSNGTLTAKGNQTGFFMSSNYPFPNSIQSDDLPFVSKIPLNLTVTLDKIDDFTTITVVTTGIYGPQNCTFSYAMNQTCKIYGTNFLFSSRSSSKTSTGGLVRYHFIDGFSHKGDNSSTDHGISWILTFILILALCF